MTVRPLAPDDAPAYVRLRREMLEDSPWAFGSSPQDDQALDPLVVAARVSEPGSAILGAFDAGRLVGSAGVRRERQVKARHRAVVWGVYVTPPARGRGLGGRLVAAALEAAGGWPGVTTVALAVSERAPAARRIYERLGFRAWGVEPAALVVGGRAYAEVHMVAFLDKAQPAGDRAIDAPPTAGDGRAA